MKKTTLALIATCLSFHLYAQLPSTTFNETEIIPCPYHLEDTVVWPVGWTLYHTLDNTWNGIIDSSYCISGFQDNFNYRIDLNTIDPLRPIFIRSQLNDENKIFLNPNYVYLFHTWIWVLDNSDVITIGDCEEDICTGLIIGIEVPDESGDNTILRTYYSSAKSDASITQCIPTEYFQENYLREYIIKVTVNSNLAEEEEVGLTYNEISPLDGTAYITQPVVPENTQVNDTTYNFSLYDLASTSGWNYLLLYNPENGYPSLNNVYYHDLAPELNPDFPVRLNLTIWDEFYEQPFTSFRPGLIASSDSVRHQLSILDESSSECLFLIDRVFGHGVQYTLKKEAIRFANRAACMMFRDGAALIVGENATLQYGHHGMGMLALGERGTIKLGNNSELIINNHLVLSDVINKPDNQIYVDLPPNTRLTFGEHASVERVGYIQGHMRLNVLMNGGILDDSALSDQERLLINRIYPKPKSNAGLDLSILANPSTQNQINWRVTLEKDQALQWALWTQNGSLVASGKEMGLTGYNFFQYPTTAIMPGLYFLKVNADVSHAVQPVFILP
ncbi:MAG TPA: hypothetical protein PKA00_05175 [Saprospiraceae bacterium]|nr:hypothetical protein [Saprospiraceae bacterium]HMQ82274.1 hypothetical protein [Saprospiraceae bacterium]